MAAAEHYKYKIKACKVLHLPVQIANATQVAVHYY